MAEGDSDGRTAGVWTGTAVGRFVPPSVRELGTVFVGIVVSTAPSVGVARIAAVGDATEVYVMIRTGVTSVATPRQPMRQTVQIAV